MWGRSYRPDRANWRSAEWTAGGHLNDTFDGAVSSVQQPLNVTETGSGATWYLYGFCASGNSLRAAQSVPSRGGR